MTYQGTVQGGVVVFDEGQSLPEGLVVRIEPADADAIAHEDALAVKAALRDMRNGDTGTPLTEFSQDFREKNGIAGE